MAEFVQIISNVGFPIAACIGMAYYIKKEGENHKAEVDGLRETIDDLKDIMTEVKTLLVNR